MFLVSVDAHSKYIIMNSTTTSKTSEDFLGLWSVRPQFTSDEFAIFAKANGIKHIRTAPYHPASYGLAERFVQSFKQSLKTTLSSGRSLSYRLSNYLLSYQSSPHATTGVAPCTLFLRQDIRTRFDLLRPDRENRVMDRQDFWRDCPSRRVIRISIAVIGHGMWENML